MITLCFVQGIDKGNVPYHTSKENRDAYFKSMGGVQVDAFFPPYYSNKINISTDDVPNLWEANYNYCILEFEGRKYYYFITDMSYISEDVVEITIEMDTIETFLFDITFLSGVIERKFINRWNADGTINRNYIRENVSKNEFDKPKVECVNNDPTQWYVMLKVTNLPGIGTTEGQPSSSFVNWASLGGKNTGTYHVSYMYGIVPYEITATMGNKNVLYAPGDFSVVPEMADMYLIPFPGIKNLSISNGVVSWPEGYAYSFYVAGKVNRYGSAVDKFALTTNGLYQNNILNKDVTFSFSKNASKYVVFGSQYVPALLDENYIQVTFGDNQCDTSYPLYHAKTPKMRCYYWAELSTGTRLYNIGFNDGSSYPLAGDNPYNTIVANSTPLSDDLKNDAWRQYIASNKATLINAAMQDSRSAIASYASDLTAKNNFDSSFRSIMRENIQDKRYKNKFVIKKKYKRQLMNLVDDYDSSTQYGWMKGLGQSAVSNYLANEVNLKFTPPGVRQSGNMATELVAGTPYIYYKEAKTFDYEASAWYFHTNGYLVEEPFFVNKDIYNYVRTRRYYNVLKMSDVNFYLSVAQPQAVLSDIEDRLLNGITLWEWEYSINDPTSSTVKIGNYRFDNVENAYL